jgi:hypothetical protein
MIGLALAVATQAAMAGSRDHQDGLFLRLSVGAGEANTKIDLGANELEVSGTVSEMNLAIGAIVTPNLALHGTLYGWMADEPDVEYGSTSGETMSDVDMIAFGAGATYYMMPLNLYVSSSLGVGTLDIITPWGAGATDPGFAVDVTIGKEWWVGGSWGLGVAGGLNYHNIPEKHVDENWNGMSLAIRFSATMN